MQILMLYIYTFFGYLLYPFIFIVFVIMMLFNKSVRKGAIARLGFDYPQINDCKAVWIHAVSVGEIVAVKEIVDAHIAKHYKIYLSTTTATGYEMAKKMYGNSVSLFYLPLDYPHMVKRVIKLISPKYVIIAEIEIWPTLIYELYKQNIPLYLVNGRIGKKELRGYKPFKFFFKPYYKMYKQIFAQSETDKKNMINIGIDESLIFTSGNLKYDITYNLSDEKYNEIKNTPPKNKFVIVAGSTHPKEEEAILNAINTLALKDQIYVVIVPRDIARAIEIQNIASKLDYKLGLFTEKDSFTDDGIIVNVIGELLYWYRRSDLVIMGGSLSPNVGGHNILEAIYFKKPVICGTCMHNFIDMYSYMHSAMFNCKSLEALPSVILAAYSDKLLRDKLSSEAHRLLLENRGASQKTMDAINRHQLNTTR